MNQKNQDQEIIVIEKKNEDYKKDRQDMKEKEIKNSKFSKDLKEVKESINSTKDSFTEEIQKSKQSSLPPLDHHDETDKEEENKGMEIPEEIVNKKGMEFSKEGHVGRTAGNWNNWDMSNFKDPAEKDKFLRLMGAKKSSNTNEPSVVTDKATKDSAINNAVAQKINSDLEKQYDFGMKMKGNRGGLGFS